MNNQTGGSHILFVTPCFNITESSKILAFKGNDCLGFLHFGGHVFVGSFGNTCAANLSGSSNSVKYGVNVLLVRCISHHDFNFFHFFLPDIGNNHT